jgi:hypothetical protein
MTTIETIEDVAFHRALTALGRSPEIPEASDAYGWLIGSWELDVRHYVADHNAYHLGQLLLLRQLLQ